MIELIIIAGCIYFTMQILLRRKDTDSIDRTTGKGSSAAPEDGEDGPVAVPNGKEDSPAAVPNEKEDGMDPGIDRGLDFEAPLKEMDREKLELKRSVRKILLLLEREKIKVDYTGKEIPKFYDSVEVYFTVRYGPAPVKYHSVKYHIHFYDLCSGCYWRLYAGVRVNGEKYLVMLPYMAKSFYDLDELAWDYHVLESEAVKVIREKAGLKDKRLTAVPIIDAKIEFSNDYFDSETAYDFHHSEEHFPTVPWEYCDYPDEEYDIESRWNYVRSRYVDYL